MAENVDFEKRALIVSGFGGLVFGALGLRMAQLQILGNNEFRLQAAENQFNLSLLPASRGVIYDRFGIQLAVNRRDFRVMVVRDEVGTRDDLNHTIDKVAAILGMNNIQADKVKKEAQLAPKYLPTQIASNLSWEKYSRLGIYTVFMNGVHPEMGEARNYPLGEAFGHVVGYVAKANANEAKDDKDLKHPAIRLGKEGVEKALENRLKGKHGAKKLEVTARGKVIREVPDPTLDPIAGEPIVTSLDAELQQLAYNQFKEGESGSAVLMDVATGELLVLCSAPSYDPNKFVNGISYPDYKAYNESIYRPLYNKVIKGLYPPASTFKMIVGLAALEHGVTTPEEEINCPGFLYIGNRRFRCMKRSGHGRLNLKDAIKVSCDVYFYEMGKRLGGDKIADTARRFGFGEAFDIGIPGVAKGHVPDSKWKWEKRKQKWAIYDSVNMSIGQGLMVATPLQLAVMTARIASKGKKIVPKLIRDKDAERHIIFEDIDVNKDNINKVYEGMVAVTNEAGGTANRDLGLEGVTIAGKTGTAQVRAINESDRSNRLANWIHKDHALFVSFAPADNPKYVCVIVSEHGVSGSAGAAPKAREILKAALIKDPINMKSFDPYELSKEKED